MLGVPVDERQGGNDSVGRRQERVQSGDGTTGGKKEVRVMWLQRGERYWKGM